eukprot:scaffold87304_cov66-Phaeocystis_antarctica.AAC.5
MIVIQVEEGLGETWAALKGFARSSPSAGAAGCCVRGAAGAARGRGRGPGCGPLSSGRGGMLVGEWRGLTLRLGVLDMNGC